MKLNEYYFIEFIGACKYLGKFKGVYIFEMQNGEKIALLKVELETAHLIGKVYYYD